MLTLISKPKGRLSPVVIKERIIRESVDTESIINKLKESLPLVGGEGYHPLEFKVTRILTSTSITIAPRQIEAGINIIECDTTDNSISITLPQIEIDKSIIYVNDIAGNAATNPIYVYYGG